MSYCDQQDDMVLELSRIAREAMERQRIKNEKLQTGEAFKDLDKEIEYAK